MGHRTVRPGSTRSLPCDPATGYRHRNGFDHRTRVGSRRTPVAQMKLSDTAAAAEGRPRLMMLRQAVKLEQQGGIPCRRRGLESICRVHTRDVCGCVFAATAFNYRNCRSSRRHENSVLFIVYR